MHLPLIWREQCFLFITISFTVCKTNLKGHTSGLCIQISIPCTTERMSPAHCKTAPKGHIFLHGKHHPPRMTERTSPAHPLHVHTTCDIHPDPAFLALRALLHCDQPAAHKYTSRIAILSAIFNCPRPSCCLATQSVCLFEVWSNFFWLMLIQWFVTFPHNCTFFVAQTESPGYERSADITDHCNLSIPTHTKRTDARTQAQTLNNQVPNSQSDIGDHFQIVLVHCRCKCFFITPISIACTSKVLIFLYAGIMDVHIDKNPTRRQTDWLKKNVLRRPLMRKVSGRTYYVFKADPVFRVLPLFWIYFCCGWTTLKIWRCKLSLLPACK